MRQQRGPSRHPRRRAAAVNAIAGGAVVLLTGAAFAIREGPGLGGVTVISAVVIAVVMLGVATITFLVIVPRLAGGRADEAEVDDIQAHATRIEHLYMRTLLDNIPDNVYFKDKDSRFLMVSKTFIEKFGNGRAESILGKTDFDIFTEEHSRPAFEGEQRIIKSGEPIINLTEKETKTDGTVSWGP